MAPPIGTDGYFGYKHGAVIRMVAEVKADGVTTHMQYAGGNDLHRTSDFYGNMLPRYLINEYVQLPFSSEEVIESAVQTYVLQPE